MADRQKHPDEIAETASHGVNSEEKITDYRLQIADCRLQIAEELKS
jgi:hypothetical protein